jgi:hypothetical protein
MLKIEGTLIGMEIIPNEESLVIVPVVGLGIPMPTPQGMAMMQIPLAAIQLGMSKEVALEKAREMLAAAEALPDPAPESDIIIANNMAAATQAAKLNDQFRGS